MYEFSRLTRKQLEDAVKCREKIDCNGCSCDYNGFGCHSSDGAAQTALQLLNQNEKMQELLQEIKQFSLKNNARLSVGLVSRIDLLLERVRE
jgi:hypothetical protein